MSKPRQQEEHIEDLPGYKTYQKDLQKLKNYDNCKLEEKKNLRSKFIQIGDILQQYVLRNMTPNALMEFHKDFDGAYKNEQQKKNQTGPRFKDTKFLEIYEKLLPKIVDEIAKRGAKQIFEEKP